MRSLAAAILAGGALSAPATAGSLVLAQAIQPGTQEAAEAVAKLGQMEEQMRQLQGQIEQLQYENHQLQQRLDQATAGQQAAGGNAAAAAPPAAEANTANTANAEGAAAGTNAPDARQGRVFAPSDQSGSTPPPAGQRGTQVLGTLPQGSFTERTPQEQGEIAAKAAAINPAAPAKQQYDAALQLMQQGQWDAARSVFENILSRYPKDQLAPNAAYWRGETYYIAQDYGKAAATFAENYRIYGAASPKAPDTLLKLGMSLAASGEKDKACQIYSELDKRFPSASAPIKQTTSRERAAAGCG